MESNNQDTASLNIDTANNLGICKSHCGRCNAAWTQRRQTLECPACGSNALTDKCTER